MKLKTNQYFFMRNALMNLDSRIFYNRHISLSLHLFNTNKYWLVEPCYITNKIRCTNNIYGLRFKEPCKT